MNVFRRTFIHQSACITIARATVALKSVTRCSLFCTPMCDTIQGEKRSLSEVYYVWFAHVRWYTSTANGICLAMIEDLLKYVCLGVRSFIGYYSILVSALVVVFLQNAFGTFGTRSMNDAFGLIYEVHKDKRYRNWKLVWR